MKIFIKLRNRKNLVRFCCALLTLGALDVQADPEEDLKAFRAYFVDKFEETLFDDFRNGVYSIDPGSRMQWESIEEFPPYESFVEMGEEEWNRPFANGNGYESCFGDDVSAIRGKYPYWNARIGKVVTLEGDINKCRWSNSEKPLKWEKGTMAHLSSYIGYEARGQKIKVIIPDDPRALKAYEQGKKFFYAKRGQLNMACADCHVYQSGQHLRGDILSPGLGQTTGFPVFRAKWSGKSISGDGLGTLHRRYVGCNRQIRAKPFKPQSDEYRNLEFFHTYMSNGLQWNGPAYRK